MNKYDLVKDGAVVEENVRFNVIAHCDGHCVTHGDLSALDDDELIECGAYERIDPAPVYDGRFNKIGIKYAGVIDNSLRTVTYKTTIDKLSLDECKEYLLKRVEMYYLNSPDTGSDWVALKEAHNEAINNLPDWHSATSYDASGSWVIHSDLAT